MFRCPLSGFIFLFLTSSFAYKVQNNESLKFGSGVNASIAKQGNVIVAVYSSGYLNTLWYRVGLIKDNKIEWGEDYRYDNGINASVAIRGNTLVEVHESEGYDTLWYHVGILDKNTKTISWGDSQKYERGQNPSVAIRGDTLVEAHQLSTKHLDYCYDDCYFDDEGNYFCQEECKYYYTHQLLYRTGIIYNSSKTIEWIYDKEYAKGKNPSIVASGNTIVETHEAADSQDLWSQVGTLQGNIIQWNSKKNYDEGVSPSVAILGNLIVEMHKAPYFNTLWYHIGKLDSAAKVIIWGSSQKYERGVEPSIASDNNSLFEIHTSALSRNLYYNIGLVDSSATGINWLDLVLEKANKLTELPSTN